jgi:uncharacterized protein (DUF1697 family)
VRYAILLRGVNLGRTNRVPMADLRRVLESEDIHSPNTYLQSGNVVVESDLAGPALEARVSEVIAQEFGLDVPALALSEAEMRRVVGGNPFADEAAADPTRVHAMFVSPMPDESALDGVDPSDYQPDEFALGPGVVYLHLPHGLGRAKLPEVIGRRFKASTVTTRNWRTVDALIGMLA